MKSGHLSVPLLMFMKRNHILYLKKIKICLMTSHMGSMSVDFRTKMEIEATKEVVRLISVETLKSEVPKEEYDIQGKCL